jgi:hypothetical protein
VIHSPDDPEAHTDNTRDTTWLGDNVPVTDTCGWPEEPLCPHVRVQVHTTVVSIPDAAMTNPLQEE